MKTQKQFNRTNMFGCHDTGFCTRLIHDLNSPKNEMIKIVAACLKGEIRSIVERSHGYLF